MTFGKMFAGVTIAMAAGAVLGLLFAPDKGSVTRKKLTKQGSRIMDALEDSASECVDLLEKNIEGVKDTAVDISERMQGAVNALAGDEPEKHKHRP